MWSAAECESLTADLGGRPIEIGNLSLPTSYLWIIVTALVLMFALNLVLKKTMIGLAIRACQAGHRVLFATAADWVQTLADAHHAGRLQAELIRLGRYPLLVVDEVGYIPFEPEAANLFFQLVSSRYERASLIVTSNKQFGRWGEVFGDDVVAAAMIDRLVHHAEVIALKGDSYRLKDRDLGRVTTATTTEE